MRRDARLARAYNCKLAAKPTYGSAANTRLTFVAGLVGVIKVGAAGAL
jgi:hypothetical protein